MTPEAESKATAFAPWVPTSMPMKSAPLATRVGAWPNQAEGASSSGEMPCAGEPRPTDRYAIRSHARGLRLGSLVVMTMKTDHEFAGGARPLDFVLAVPRSLIAGADQ